MERLASTLPFLTPDLPGVGGNIKQKAADFMVEEEPLYEPSGQGDHLYITLEYSKSNTMDITHSIQKLFALKNDGVGFAGLKDKQSVSRQTFSIYLPRLSDEIARSRLMEGLPDLADGSARLLSFLRHGNRLRRGHLKGNRFQILLRNLDCDQEQALARIKSITKKLQSSGWPNYFGLQRFGKYGDNHLRGLALLKKEIRPSGKNLRDLLISALQAHLFNMWLNHRITDNLFEKMIPGDVMRKTESGGLFVQEEPDQDQERFLNGAIACAGPIFGKKLFQAAGIAREREQALLEEIQITAAAWPVDGSRRQARMQCPELAVNPDNEGIWLSFFLPSGSYATIFLREFCKKDFH